MLGQQFMESAPTTMITIMDGPQANFRIGEVFDADDRSAGYVVRLAMALNDMRTNHGLIERDDVKTATRQWLVRIMVAQIRETAFIITPPKPTSIITLKEYLSPFAEDNATTVREVASHPRCIEHRSEAGRGLLRFTYPDGRVEPHDGRPTTPEKWHVRLDGDDYLSTAPPATGRTKTGKLDRVPHGQWLTAVEATGGLDHSSWDSGPSRHADGPLENRIGEKHASPRLAPNPGTCLFAAGS
ncbi:MAG: hypothetical protein JWN65_1302 [Solirubrobacterales bacterium]|nr:hypothetical protein [Solirubrobacterales bacterium]